MPDPREETVAWAMWSAVRANALPTHPIALPFEELAEADRYQLLVMARAAIRTLENADA